MESCNLWVWALSSDTFPGDAQVFPAFIVHSTLLRVHHSLLKGLFAVLSYDIESCCKHLLIGFQENQWRFSCLWDGCPRGQSLGPTVATCVSSYGTARLSLLSSGPFYFPTRNLWGIQFLHILTGIWWGPVLSSEMFLQGFDPCSNWIDFFFMGAIFNVLYIF